MAKKISLLFAISALLVNIAAWQCHGDLFRQDSGNRNKFSLDGKWKCAAGDFSSAMLPDFDDSAWTQTSVPAKSGTASLKNSPVVWCRKQFTPPKNEYYALLRIESLAGEGEIWLNGSKLSNPLFHPPLEDRQAGTYLGGQKLNWPGYFPIWDEFRSGEQNVIAMRLSLPPSGGSSAPAIDGNVFILSPPAVFISNMERSVPARKNLSDAVEHRFIVALSNAYTDPVNTDVSFSITCGGKAVFRDSDSKSVAGGGDVAEFIWKTSPKFADCTARANLGTNSGIKDSASLDFHTTLVETMGNRIFVNGNPFTIKGIDGIPGSEYPRWQGSGAIPISIDAAMDDARRLAEIGVNTIRTEYPAPAVLDAAIKYGLMVIPVLRGDWRKTVLAIRDRPNILYWDIEWKHDSAQEAGSIAALDSYGRPIGHSLATGSDGPSVSGLSAVFGIDAMERDTSVCDGSAREFRHGSPVVLLNWGASAEMVAWEHAPAGVLPALADVWNTCVVSGRTAGAVYFALADAGDTAPSLRGRLPGEWNPLMQDILSSLYSDISASRIDNDLNRPAMMITNNNEYPLLDFRVFPDEKGKRRQVAYSEAFAPDDSISVPLSALNGPALARYETHGGLQHSMIIDYSLPSLDTGTILQWTPPGRLHADYPGTIVLIIRGADEPAKADVQITVDPPEVGIKPASRGVFVPAGSYVEVPFTIIGADGIYSAAVTATVTFSSPERFPLKSFIALTFD